MIDRVPDIDSASGEGLKPAGIKGQVIKQTLLATFDEDNNNQISNLTLSIQLFQISFNGVHFNYPARKDVPILRG